MNKNIIITAIITFSIGAGGGYWFAQTKHKSSESHALSSDEKKPLFYRNPMNPAITSPVFTKDEMGMDYIPVYADEEKPKEKEILFYRNPMNPAITSTVFTKDEMGMDYIPVYADDANNDEPAGTVTIDPVVVQNIGVRTAVAEKKSIARTINSLGHVDFNEEYITRLHPKTDGWIGTLRVDETGTSVGKDTILLSIYSPDLVAAQREYLVALKNWETVKISGAGKIQLSTKNLLKSALERLELFDVPAHQIAELQKTRKIQKYLHIHSPFKGTVMNIGAREGQYVSPKDELYLIADLKKIWVHVDIYENDMPWVKVGDEVEMQVRAAPGQLFKGKVRFIYPYLEGKTRTVRVRLEFNNTDLVLKPGMFANVLIKTDEQPDAIVVPSEAIVRSGNREQVFIQREPGKFEPREVILGLSAQGFTQVREGIKAGDQVVTSAVFLIDSESKLREATAKMMEATSMDMNSDMDMGNMGMGDMTMEDMSMDDMSMDSMSMEENNNAFKASGK